CFAPGSKVICCIAGRWGERWRNLCKAFQLESINLTCPLGQSIQPAQLAGALKQHPDAAGVCATLSETATGARGDIQAFGKLVAATPAVLVVDAISGLGVVECRTDDWHVDVCVTGSQKALMLPPGLAFVSVSEKAWKKIDATPVRAFYLDLRRYRKSLAESDTPFTPANTLIRAQRASLKRIRAEGIENLWARHAKIAAACRAGVRGM